MERTLAWQSATSSTQQWLGICLLVSLTFALIHPEEYKLPDEIRSPEQLTKSTHRGRGGPVDGAWIALRDLDSATGIRCPASPGISPHWEATYTVYGVLG